MTPKKIKQMTTYSLFYNFTKENNINANPNPNTNLTLVGLCHKYWLNYENKLQGIAQIVIHRKALWMLDYIKICSRKESFFF